MQHVFTQLLYIIPFAIVVGLLATGRVSGLIAGLVGLVCAAPAAYLAWPGADGGGDFALRFLYPETLRGAWLAWQAIAVLAAGVLFHNAVSGTTGTIDRVERNTGNNPRRRDHDDKPSHLTRYRVLFRATFLLGIFAESLTGFGVGYLVAFSVARGVGLRGVYAVVLPGFSQIAVPFGAMSVGTGIGASLANIPVVLLGQWSAAFTAVMMLGYLSFFWSMCARAGLVATRADKLSDVATMLAMAGFFWLWSTQNAVELAGIAAAGTMLLVDVLRRDRALSRARWIERWLQAWPYVLVSGALLASRIIPGAREALSGGLTSRPYDDLPGFAWLFNPSVFLLAAAVATVVVRGALGSLPGLLRKAAASAWRAIAVTLVFVVFAQWLNAAGVAHALAAQAINTLGPLAIVMSPFIGALGGFLTGSNTGSNSMAMPIQAALAEGAALPQGLLPGLQNTVGSNFALLAPQRVAMMRGLAAPGITEATILRALLPLGAMVIILAITMVAVAMIAGR